MQKADVAFLVYEPLKQRRKDNSFDGNDNIGAKVIEAVLKAHGIAVGYCSPQTANQYRLVLVSLTSTYDVYAFYQAVALLPSWQPGKRSFKVMAGGFGMQNPTAIRNYVDYAAFGRAHDWIAPVVEAILGGGEPDAHPSLMKLPDLAPVVIHQTEDLYQGVIDGKTPYGERFVEHFTGCPLKCKFCHYTWARRYTDNRETRGSYVQKSLTGGGTPELTWDQLFTWGKKIGRARVAIDGFSERLRWIYGKKISQQDIIGGLEAVGEYEGNTVILAYNISNFPSETDADREELYATLMAANPKNRVVFILHSTPFRPSLATPMQWERVTLLPDWSKRRTEKIVDRDTILAEHSFTLETPFSHMMSVVAERATPDTDRLFHTLAFNKYLQSARHDLRLRAVEREFDLTPYLREYDFDEKHPAWFLSSYTDREVLRRIATKMRAEASDAAYQLKGRSMVVARLEKHRSPDGGEREGGA
jgi:radical SAM superfamily enzyme YgiQ (UPF0313 family)